jgi:mannose PTS system EIIA component
MVGVIVISESKASNELLSTVRKVLNRKRLPGIKAVTFKASVNYERRQVRLKKLINKMDGGDGVLIMTELFGASQTNVCKKLLKNQNVQVICGYNLPMLIEVASLNEKSKLPVLCEKTRDIGKKYIKCVCCS